MIPALGARRPLGNLSPSCRAGAWGICSGGFACFHPGGTYVEKEPGAKRRRIHDYVLEYRRQIGDRHSIGAEGP